MYTNLQDYQQTQQFHQLLKEWISGPPKANQRNDTTYPCTQPTPTSKGGRKDLRTSKRTAYNEGVAYHIPASRSFLLSSYAQNLQTE